MSRLEKKQGAEVVVGGGRSQGDAFGPGFFYRPTVRAGVKAGHRCYVDYSGTLQRAQIDNYD